MSAPPDIDRSVRQKFVVKEFFALPEDEAEYQVEFDSKAKGKFEDLFAELAPMGYRPELSSTGSEFVLVVRKTQPPAGKRSRVPVLLALFTMASVFVFSLIQEIADGQLSPLFPGYLVIIGYCGSVAAMMALHDLAQRYSARKRGGGRSTSYLIPGIPLITSFLPSLGFAATQREPAVNRDSLFDTVFVGPIAILLLAMLFYAVGDLTRTQSAITLDAARAQLANSTLSFNTINPNALQYALDTALTPWLPNVASGYVPISPLADGATVGFLLAFIGFLPIASYDGGYLSSLAWRGRAAKAAGYLSVLALLAIDTPNYWALGIIALLLAGRPFQPKILDEVSPLSVSRQWVFIGTLVIAILCLPIPQNLATFLLP